MEVALA